MEIEFKILDWIQSIRTPIGDVVMPIASGLGNAGLIWIVLAAFLLLRPKTKKSGAILLLALMFSVILCNVLLKNLFCRVRPCEINDAIQLLIARPHDFSFPSGHTAASFAAVSALYFAGEKKKWKPALALAVVIAFSRMYLYVHYPTDILGGIAVGVAAGYMGYRAVEKLQSINQIIKQQEER